ncbi:hypothetical protein BGZ57DRAFT_435316 [Hyaloscypha finlandica]|nr:hypothetical protein BGZ57DRAFT_435316 [Hyaloscypha finlandica]
MTRLKLDQWEGRWLFSRGATKATHGTEGRSMTELTEALAEVDGLLAGINYQEKLEPDSEETRSNSARNVNSSDSFPSNPTTASWFGHLAFDLLGSGSEERSESEPKHLRNILNEKLVQSNDEPHQAPRESQWATIRSLRKASMLHYNQFAKLTADSTNPDIRKLRKSCVTAKKLLEMGILTFRQVLHGQTPTTLVDIFAFASLSYVISKTLHAKGHIDESDILSGILDWRAAIVDDRERPTFDEIAKQLWPEAKEIMHFIPLESTATSQETAGLRPDEDETSCAPSIIPQEATVTGSLRPGEENVTSQHDPSPSPWAHKNISALQPDTFSMPCLSEMENPPGGLQSHVYHLTHETRSYPDFSFSEFSDWFNHDSAVLEGLMDSTFYQPLAPDISPEVLNTSQTAGLIGTELHPVEPESSPLHGIEAPSPVEQISPPVDDSALHLLETPLFQAVFRFMIQISEMGDLLNVLSGGGLTSGKDGIKPPHSRPPWVASEFLIQASLHFLGPLHREAVHIDKTFGGIVAMAEMFVKLGCLQTVREVENYIITVGRHLTHSYDLFATLVSKTLCQCFVASRSMEWDLLYPNCVQEADEYNFQYLDRRQTGETKWAELGFGRQGISEAMSSPASSTNENPQKRSPSPKKRPLQDGADSVAKRRPRDMSIAHSQSSPSGSDTSIIERCTFENCPKYYTGTAALSNLSRHVRTKHRKKKNTFICPICRKETDRRDNLRQHFMKVHANVEQPDCIANRSRGLQDARSAD